MLENIFQMIKDFGQEQVVENPEIPNEQNEAVMAEASHAVAGTLQTELAKGNIAGIMNMFGSSSSTDIMGNPVAQNMQAGFMDNISSKLGINKNVAAGLAATLIPLVLSKLVHRTNSTDPGDSGFNLNSLVSGLTGGVGNGQDIGGLLNQFTGNNSGLPGGFDLNNIISQVSQGANQQQQSGGLSSLINGFFSR